MKIDSGSVVILVMQNPREKILGVLHDIDQAGVYIRGFDLNYFDDLVNAIRNDEPYLPMQDAFYPMWRVERVSRDEKSHGMQSMEEQFMRMTGLKIAYF